MRLSELSVKQIAYTAIGAAAALFIGSFLPWVKVTAAFVGTLTKSGMDGGDGVFSLLAGLAIGFVGVSVLQGRVQRAMPWVLIVLGNLCVMLAIYEWIDISNAAGDDELEGLAMVSVGVGVYVVALGGIAAVVAGAALRGREEAPAAPPAADPAA